MEAKLHGKLWFDVLKILVGSSLVAISFRYLTFPNSIVSGGVTGIAQIVNLLTGLPVGIVTVAINTPLFIWAWKKLGKRFVGLTLLCMLTSSLLIDLLAHFPYTVTEEPMLAAVYVGLGFRCGLWSLLYVRRNGRRHGHPFAHAPAQVPAHQYDDVYPLF